VVIKAKCPNCGGKAEIDDDMSFVKCESCGFNASYDSYFETMKERAISMADDFQFKSDKKPI
jgi:hypothetical protein